MRLSHGLTAMRCASARKVGGAPARPGAGAKSLAV